MSVAGPSRFPPPPDCMQPDDPSAADPARNRVTKRRSLLGRLSLPTLSSKKSLQKKEGRNEAIDEEQRVIYDEPESYGGSGLMSPAIAQVSTPEVLYEIPEVELDDDLAFANVELEEDYDKDVYRWAILYENQRGATIFSTPYYSPLSLLPMDPPPFTIPTNLSSPRANQPTVSLSSYPLPDGTWRWVSRAWMVDMRGDGQTQYDGFEYNWFFRGKKWRSQVGHLNAGGWVRRRRWVRLMMRPAKAGKQEVPQGSGNSTPGDLPHHDHAETGATRPPSVILHSDDEDDMTVDDAEVWRGNREDDWRKCRTALKRLGRDGRKLELWNHWLYPSHPASSLDGEKGKGKAVQGDVPSSRSSLIRDDTLAEEAGTKIDKGPREHIAAVLRAHGTRIMQMFVYPESRAQFVELLSRSGLLEDLWACTDGSGGLQALDFWSYSSSLDRITDLGC